MKKLLLSLALVLGLSSVASAALTADFTTADGMPTADSADPTTATIGGIDFTFVNCKKGTYSGASYLQISGKNKDAGSAYIEFKADEAVKTVSMLTGDNASVNVIVELSVNGTVLGEAQKLSEKNATFTFDVPAANQAAGTVYRLAVTNNYNAQLKSLTLNGEGGSTEPVEPTVTEVADIAGFLAAANTASNTTIKGATTAVYQNGRYLWIKDNSGVLLTYNGGDIEMPTFVNGQTVNGGITGKYQDYNNGQLQMSALVAGTFTAGATGTAVEPELLQVEEIANDLVNTYIMLKGVKVEAGEKANNYVVSDASGSVVLYNPFSNANYYDVVNVSTGENMTVYAFVSAYQGVCQLYPVRVTAADGREVVAAPTFSPAAGEVKAGTEVSIACATEGATIYYTTDGSNPTAASTVYSAPIAINEAVTLKAIAVKAGMDDSEVVTAAYTVKAEQPVVGSVVTFNFADPSTLTPSYSEDDAVADGSTGNFKIDLENGDIFTNGPVTIAIDAQGNPARVYLQGKNHDWTFRFFKNSVLTIKVAEGYVLKGLDFEAQTAAYATALGNCTFTGAVYSSADQTAAANADVTEITIANPAGSAGATIGLVSLDVNYDTNAGVAAVEVDADAPAVYYNLQGVAVEGELAPGLYIRRQGAKSTKVLVK